MHQNDANENRNQKIAYFLECLHNKVISNIYVNDLRRKFNTVVVNGLVFGTIIFEASKIM